MDKIARAGLIALAGAIGAAPVAEAQTVTAGYPEGIGVVGETVYFAAMTENALYRRSADGATARWDLPVRCGPTGVQRLSSGLFAAPCHLAHKVLWLKPRPGAGFGFTVVRTREVFRPNGLTPGPAGGLFVSSSGEFSRAMQPAGAVLYFDEQGARRRVVEGLRYSNGVAYDGARKLLYVSEHLGGRVLRLELDAQQRARRRTVALDLAELAISGRDPHPMAGPDGLHLAANGDLLIAIYGAGAVLKRSASGSVFEFTAPQKFVTTVVRQGGTLVVGGPESIETQDLSGPVAFIAETPGLWRSVARRAGR